MKLHIITQNFTNLIVLALFIMCPNAFSKDIAMEETGYTGAPPCSIDINRNFSLYQAILALERAGSSTNPTTIKNEMHTAYLNLEQVMNQGALYWDECVSCNPYLSIDANIDHSYMNTAQRLVNFSRNFYNNPNYNEYLGLVETMDYNYQNTLYCGDYVASVDINTIKGAYEFGRVSPSETVLCGGSGQGSVFSLTDQLVDKGYLLKSCNGNESFYWFLDNEIVFLDSYGYISSILYSGGKDYWEGPYKIDISARIAHYISRDTSQNPCDYPSWHPNPPPVAQLRFIAYGWGDTLWANDGTVYWGVGSNNSKQYFIVQANSVVTYDWCGKLLRTFVIDKRQRTPAGLEQWLGYFLDASGNPTGGRGEIIWG